MDKERTDKQNQNDGNEFTFRSEFGLASLTTQQPELPLDDELIRRFVENSKISGSEFSAVVDRLARFENWRDAVKEKFRSQTNAESVPSSRQSPEP